MNIIVKVEVDGIRQLFRDIPEFIPEAGESYWNDIEIHPVKEIEKGIYEITEEGDEDFWSVYFHQLNGVFKCVANLNTKREAKKLAELFENASNYRVYSKSS